MELEFRFFNIQTKNFSTSRVVTAQTSREVGGDKKMSAAFPQTYTNIPPVGLPRQELVVPKQEGPNRPECHLMPDALPKEYW